MVGLQVARESARELNPARIVIASLRDDEVREAIEFLSKELAGVELIPAAGDIFIPHALQGRRRAEIVGDRDAYDELFREIFTTSADYKKSALFQLIDAHQPDVIVDCINTATAISYQDEFKVAEKTYALLRNIEEAKGDAEKLARLPEFIGAVRELLISQGVPQIARHILFLHRALQEGGVRVYVKVGTTGTGGMGINIPYTHSEDKPSLQLLAKSAIGFAHTGLLFLLARTPGGADQNHGAIVKEIKPGAMIGFKRIMKKHVALRGERSPALLVNALEEPVGETLQLREDAARYGRFENRDVPLEIVGADTGENGFFTIGEFQAITYPRQMEYVTPEEVARTAVLEILGASTGRDVLSAIDGAITEPSYRAGVLRDYALRAMKHLEEDLGDVLPSIAIGHLGPPKLSKLLAEAHLIVGAAGTDDVSEIRRIAPADLQRMVERYLEENPRITSLIVTVGVPILRVRDGKLVLTRGPRISIPPAPAEGVPVVALDDTSIERHARNGWVDLRLPNFVLWQQRLSGIESPNVQEYGSAALDVKGYAGDRFVPGDIVGWLLTNEPDEQGMVGRRLY
jgi:hypothetical protein